MEKGCIRAWPSVMKVTHPVGDEFDFLIFSLVTRSRVFIDRYPRDSQARNGGNAFRPFAWSVIQWYLLFYLQPCFFVLFALFILFTGQATRQPRQIERTVVPTTGMDPFSAAFSGLTITLEREHNWRLWKDMLNCLLVGRYALTSSMSLRMEFKSIIYETATIMSLNIYINGGPRSSASHFWKKAISYGTWSHWYLDTLEKRFYFRCQKWKFTKVRYTPS